MQKCDISQQRITKNAHTHTHTHTHTQNATLLIQTGTKCAIIIKTDSISHKVEQQKHKIYNFHEKKNKNMQNVQFSSKTEQKTYKIQNLHTKWNKKVKIHYFQ